MQQESKHLRVLTQMKEVSNCADRLLGIAHNQAPPITKAAVAAIGTDDVTFVADPDAQPLLQGVRRGVPGRLIELGAVSVPSRQLLPVVPSDPEPVWVTEGGSVPLGRLTSTNLYTESHYYMLMLPYLRELLKIGDTRARNLILSRSTRALSRADSAVFLGTAAGSAAQPEGVLYNRSAIGGGSGPDLADDLEELTSYVSDGDAFAPVFILSARAAIFLNASSINAFRDIGIKGGTIAGAPAIIARAAAERLILVDASQIAITDDGLDVRTSENAAIQMDDSPTNNSATGTHTNVTSAFQTGAIVLRYVRYLSWKLLRDDAVGFIDLPIGGSPS